MEGGEVNRKKNQSETLDFTTATVKVVHKACGSQMVEALDWTIYNTVQKSEVHVNKCCKANNFFF